MVLKYQDEVVRLGCDLSDYQERTDRAAHCFVFDQITDERNFVPTAKTTGIDKCTRWALSFYDTERKAKDRMKELRLKNPNLYLKIGTHIASGTLSQESGISQDSSSNGHFNHHEYAGNDFKKTFEVGNLSYI